MVLDIDRFGRINDSLGPERGDQVLQVIGHRLRESMGDRTPAEPAGGGGLPRLKVARLAADEFGVLISDVGPVEEVLERAYRLLAVVRAPIRVPGQEITLAARIGVAMMPDHATEADALLKAAETALNRAKRAPGEQVALFSEEMKVAAFLRFTLEGDLRRAIGEEELQVLYQPIVDVRGRRIAKAEALVRWAAPGAGHGAAAGVHLAGRGDRHDRAADPGGDRAGVSDIAQMGDALPPDFRVSINLSGVNFMDPQLIPTIRAVLDGGAGAAVAHRVRAHRDGADARPRLRYRHPGPAPRDGHPGGGGRFRHRLLVAGLPAPAGGEYPQDRSQPSSASFTTARGWRSSRR